MNWKGESLLFTADKKGRKYIAMLCYAIAITKKASHQAQIANFRTVVCLRQRSV